MVIHLWPHSLNGHEFEQAPGVGNGQGSLACCSLWDHKSHTWLKWLICGLNIQDPWSYLNIQSYLLPLSSHFYFTYLISVILPRVLVWVKYNIVKSIWVREHSQPPSCDLTLCLIPSPSYLLVNLSSLINWELLIKLPNPSMKSRFRIMAVARKGRKRLELGSV